MQDPQRVAARWDESEWALPIKAGRVFVNQGPRALARQIKEYLRWLALRV